MIPAPMEQWNDLNLRRKKHYPIIPKSGESDLLPCRLRSRTEEGVENQDRWTRGWPQRCTIAPTPLKQRFFDDVCMPARPANQDFCLIFPAVPSLQLLPCLACSAQCFEIDVILLVCPELLYGLGKP